MSIDVDATWDPAKCTLDEHRQAEFAKIVQVPFGKAPQPKAEPAPQPEPQDGVDETA
jgi:hypothetical protein